MISKYLEHLEERGWRGDKSICKTILYDDTDSIDADTAYVFSDSEY